MRAISAGCFNPVTTSEGCGALPTFYIPLQPEIQIFRKYFKNMNTMRIFFALMLIAGLWACNGAEKTPAENTTTAPQDTTAAVEEALPSEPLDTTPPAPYENIEWKLSTMAGQKPFKDAVMTVQMKKGTIRGLGGCNQYSGTYTVDDKRSAKCFRTRLYQAHVRRPDGAGIHVS
jgi:hypothetical protein